MVALKNGLTGKSVYHDKSQFFFGLAAGSETFLADGAPVLTTTLDDGSSGTETFSAPEGAVLTATWTTGSFTSEVSFELLDASGAIVAGGDFGNTIDYTIPNLTTSNIPNHYLYIGGSFSNISQSL